MTAPTVTFSLSEELAGAVKKRVLLVDASPQRSELRAEAMRKLGMQVDCACDIPEARSWWKADLYDLVLIGVEKGHGTRDKFCDDVRSATPRQQLAFFVGKPDYLAVAPTLDEALAMDQACDLGASQDVRVAMAVHLEGLPQRWGILEACRRMSAVRSLSGARAQAMRNRPAPPRDSEARPSRRTTPRTLDELLREEMR